MSAACTVHCLVAPFLFLAMPRFAGMWAHPASHALVALVVLPLAATVVRNGYRRHGRRWIIVAALLGTGFIVAGSVLPYLDAGEKPAVEDGAAAPCTSCCPHLVESDEGEQRLVLPAASIVTVIGSFLLISSHIGNMVACRCCRLATGSRKAKSDLAVENPRSVPKVVA